MALNTICRVPKMNPLIKIVFGLDESCPFNVHFLNEAVMLTNSFRSVDSDLVKELRTDTDGIIFPQPDKVDCRFTKYTNAAYWYIMYNSTNKGLIQRLFEDLVTDLGLRFRSGESHTPVLEDILDKNLLERLPLIMINRPYLVKPFCQIFDVCGCEDDDYQPFIEVLEKIGANIKAKTLIKYTIANIFADNHFDERVYLVTDTGQIGSVNEDIICDERLSTLLHSSIVDHSGMEYTFIPDIWEKDPNDDKNHNALTLKNATLEQTQMIYNQLYSAILSPQFSINET